MIDLHAHSTASDGQLTPKELMELAASLGMKACALTDHDTLSGLPGAEERARALGLVFIPGVELEIDHEGLEALAVSRGRPPEVGEFHMLGLRLAGDRSALSIALDKVRTRRNERNLRIIEKMRAGGINVSVEELKALAPGDVVSRAHFARLLLAKGVVSSVAQAFSRYIGRGKPFYEERRSLGLAEAVSLIRDAGGVAVIAHPVSLELQGTNLRRFVSACREMGVRGIEVYHPNHTEKQARSFLRMAEKMGMIPTGGSDFHGRIIPQRVLGHSTGGMEIPDALLEGILSARTGA